MKILYDYQIFHMQKFGGISNYFYNLINNLNNNTKNNIEVFAPLYINNYLDLIEDQPLTAYKIKAHYYANADWMIKDLLVNQENIAVKLSITD